MAERKITIEDDLPTAWNILIAQLEDEAGLKLNDKQEHSLDQVMAVIKGADAAPGLASKTANVIDKTFICVDRLGGMIAQASSIVFGPSAQVWNAISFLIHAAQDTKAVFDNLAALLERTYIFLERLRGFLDNKTDGEKLDKRLRVRFYAALEQFIKIMALSYKLTHSWQQGDGGLRGKLKKAGGRVVAFVKVGAFGDDSGVKSAMEGFESAVSDISGVQIDIIYRDLSDAAKNICVIEETVGKIYGNTQDIVKAVDKLGEAQAVEKVNEKVRKSLGIDKKKENLHTSAHSEYSSMIPGTAAWLFERSDYHEWADVTESSTSHSILSIAAPAGYGKSYLTHAIINNLNEKGQALKQQVVTRTAWYYFPKEYKANDRALKHIIWELADADAAYLHFLSNSKDLHNLDGSKLWTRVVTSYTISRAQPEVFFIILDGLENIDKDLKDELNKIIIESQETESVLQLRFLLTGPQSLLQEMQREARTTWDTIDLLPASNAPSATLPHQQDIKRFTERELGRVQMFKNDSSKNTEDIKSRILTELPKAARGSYTHIEQQIREIDRAEDLSEVEQLLKRLDRNGAEIIKEEISRLNRQLGGARIHHLNEIIAWVSVAQELLSVDTIRAILELKFESAGIKDPETWVRKYCPHLFDIDNSGKTHYVQFQPGAEDALRDAEGSRDVVTDAEIDMIQAMLRTTLNRSFGNDSIFDRFEFADFFEGKRIMQKHLVHLKPSEASLTVLQTCLQAICDLHDDGRPEFGSLRDYAREYFDEHLVLTDISEIEVESKTKLGRSLYRLLKDDVVIDTWAIQKHFSSMIAWLYEEDGTCAAMIALLKDPDVQRSIQAVYTSTEWLYAEKPVSVPNEDILQHVARRMLERVYDGESESDPYWPCYWLRAYFLRAGSDSGKYKKKNMWSDATMMEARSFEAWARPQLQNVVDAKWHFFMANYLFSTAPSREGKQQKRHFREACERCEKSFELDPSRWAVQILRSQILSQLQDYEACIRVLDALRETMTLGQDEEYDKAYWKTIVPGMGDCHVNLKAYAKAASWFAQSYHFHMENDEVSDATEDVTCKLLKAYIEQSEPEKAWEIVHALDARLKNNKSWLSSMLENPGSDLHEHLLLLARDHETYTIVDTYYDKTIKGTDEDAKKSGARHFLEYTKGRLHIYCGPSDTRKLVLSRWEAIASHLRDHDNDWGWWTRRQLIQEYTKAWCLLSSQASFELHEQQEEINKLSKLSEINNDLNTYSLYREAKLALARFLTTHGKLEEAREVLKPLITKALEQARTVDDADDGYERLALILPTINDDVNALAAWSTMLPSPVKEDDDPDEGDTPPAIDNTPNGGTEPPATAGATEHDPSSSEDDGLDESADDKKDSDELTGNAGFLCDGRCGRRWSYADDIWVCRDCLCVQLDTGCLEMLKRGELPITICHPKHEHLHVPPFDERAWKESRSSDLKVGSEMMSRDVWLAMLEREWGVEKKELEAA